MNEFEIGVKTRSATGSRAAGRLRDNGEVPAVLYGKSGTRNLLVNHNEFAKLWGKAGSSNIVMIKDESGNEVRTLIQSVQRHATLDKITHIDFYELVKGEAILAHIPVHAVGTPVGVKQEGGTLEIVSHEVEIRCLPRHLPSQIEVDTSRLHAGDSIHIRDLPVLEGVTYQGDPDNPVISVVAPSGPKASVDTEEEPSES
ncbi:MAG: 50S ribosomal protein L25 [Puniceicoccaceae bacterium]